MAPMLADEDFRVCADIEARIRTERLDQLESRVEAMCAEVQVVLQALKRLLDATL
jgi:tetrahydromethanopterin S-methyltransferase subunit G